jgi:2-polyprenyl-3-methyl-5-hydroxy-6-metoxy-1,4-benzoquinol methylase
MTKQKCVLNKGHKQVRYFTKRNNINIYRCLDCGTIMADTEFVEQQHEEADYYSIKYKNIIQIDKYWGFRFRYILRKILKFNKGTLLDIGAGNGYFVYTAKTKYSIKAEGVEISKKEIEFAEEVLGLTLLNKNLTEFKNQSFDIISIFNVIEHVDNPKEFLKQASEIIKKDGLIVIITPNPRSFNALINGLKTGL